MGHQGDAYGETRVAGGETARAVDRVDDEKRVAGKAFGRIRGFLRQPSEFGRERREALVEKMVDAQIGFGDRRAAMLVCDFGMGRGAVAKIFERHLASLADNRLDGRQDRGIGGQFEQKRGLLQ